MVLSLVSGYVSNVSASTRIRCLSDLPENNNYGLPANWAIELDTDEDTAHVSYSGGPKEGRDAKKVNGNFLASEEFSGGWEISGFGYKLKDRELRMVLSFKDETFKSGELRFRAKTNRLQKSAKTIESSSAFCSPVN